MTGLPEPRPGRFVPLRLGLVDLFQYDVQEFRFRDGRLLIRGDNGSGKSKVLALTLPLLLDANLASHRVEPDADRGKHMYWNLLQGGEYDERTGYSWIEFGRIDELGERRFVTLGLGMKAVAGRGIVRQWWFTTAQRIGDELHLVDPLHTVLTRERLGAAIGDAGIVRETAEAYRRDVDGLLFGLGEQRYASIVDLLVHLRQPQLSKRPDEQTLGRALSDSLRPLGQDVIEDVAQAFQTLEEDRAALEDLRQSARAVRAFTAEYARYARVASARAAEGPRRAQSAVDAAQRALREARAVQQQAADRLRSAQAAAAAIEDEVERARAAIDALRDLRASDAYTGLQTARQEADRAAGAAERAEQEAEDAVGRADRAAAESVTAAEDASGSAAAVRASIAESAEAAARAGISMPDEADAILLTAEADRRRDQVAAVRTAIDAEQAANAARTRARQAVDDAQARLAAARAEAAALADTAARAATAWVEAARSALGGAVELRPDDDELLALIERAADWSVAPDGLDPVAVWADGFVQTRSALLASGVERLRAERAREQARQALLDQERARLAAGGVTPPPQPYTRDAERSAGVPLWRAVDVVPGLDDAAWAGLEAALEAAGLLDAWIHEDATLTTVAGDVLLVAAPVAGPTLADVLRPVIRAGGPVSADRVDALLHSIALGERDTAVWVATDGRFRLGPARGAWTKPAAVLLGESARELARARRLEAIAAEQASITQTIDGLTEALAAIARRDDTLRAERRALPFPSEARRAADFVTAAGGRTTRAEQTAADAADRSAVADRAWTDTHQALAWTAGEFRLPADPAALEAVAAAVADLRSAARVLADRARAAAASALRADAAAERAADAAVVLQRRRDESVEAKRIRTAALQRYDTVRESAGEDVLELDTRLAQAEQGLDVARSRSKVAQSAAATAIRAAGDADARADDAALREADAVDARAVATEAFRGFASTGVLRLLPVELEIPDPAGPWAPDPTVRLARRVPAAAADLEDAAWDLAQNRLQRAFDTVQTALGVRGRSAEQDVQHGIAVVTVRTGVRRLEPDVLADELELDVADRERLLTEQEREILENHLLDEVASGLQALMHDADVQVAAMNRELEARPTSSGLRIRISWKPVDESGLDQARRRLLLQTAAAWSPADRKAIGDFLQDRIDSERAADPEGVWHERLTAALDYRRWNRFVVELHQNGAWRPASGPASGGERVLAASVPLFAAASAHYGSAAAHAPRLILLDEAFAGVDDRSRASYLGLLATFDLDVVMTSEREWAAYPEVPGIAIANLTRMEGVRAVHVDHWEWDGSARRRVADPGPSAVAERPQQRQEDLLLELE